jgi:cbb3-type cytochrome oxidase maturation protein
MSIIYILLPLALLLSFGFLAAFIWSVKDGQFDELDSPSYRLLFDSPTQKGKDHAGREI